MRHYKASYHNQRREQTTAKPIVREWCAGGVQFQMRTPHQTGGTSKQMTTHPTTTTGRGGNLEGLPTKDTVKAFWGKGPASQRAHHEMGG